MIKKISFIVLFFSFVAAKSYGQAYEVDSTLLLSSQDMQWWKNAKFGMFIHYGLYSVLGENEWAMFSKQIDIDEYAKLKEQFNCEKGNPQQWVDVAKSAGCRYMVVTTRHHDGFCIFDTKFGEFDAINSATKRDLIAEYADAAHKAGMKLGFYYSPLDWRFPGFFFPEMYRSSAEEMKKQTYAQERELLTKYGKVDILWYDGGEDSWLGLGGLMWRGDKGWYTRGVDKPYTGKFSWEPLRLNKMVRELQPKIVISERSGMKGDFSTQEVRLKGKADGPWEFCTTIGGTWGWTPNTTNQTLTLDSCIKLLVKVVSLDGNLLLNVGPKPNGEIEPIQAQRLKEIGNFLSKYGESIYDTRGGSYNETWGGTTVSDKAIYVHILKVPSDRIINLPSVKQKISSGKYLHDNSKATFVQSVSGIRLSGISPKQNETDLIIKLSLK
jgi:alpha-L-fucosidase